MVVVVVGGVMLERSETVAMSISYLFLFHCLLALPSHSRLLQRKQLDGKSWKKYSLIENKTVVISFPPYKHPWYDSKWNIALGSGQHIGRWILDIWNRCTERTRKRIKALEDPLRPLEKKEDTG